MTGLEIVGRLLLAVLCSAVIGFERETAQKDAGFRTHILVGVGAAIFTLVSIDGFGSGDPARVAAQVVTGVGFLGAGAIFKEGATVRGLTTAAGLWAVAAVGVASGSGSIVLAIVGTVLVVGVLVTFRQLDEYVARRTRKVGDQIELHLDELKHLQAIVKFANRIDPNAQQVSFKRRGNGGVLILAVQSANAGMLTEMLASHKGVVSAERLPPLHWVRPESG